LSIPPQSVQLSTEIVVSVASILTLEDGVFFVGGQALNLWAERYAASVPALSEFGPYTSKDIDYFGHREAAQKLADALNGEVSFPSIDHAATPSTAMVRATIGGQSVLIDFINGVLGIRRTERLQRDVVELEVPMHRADGSEHRTLLIPVMHPVHCLMSRIANVLSPATRRNDEVALRQLRASPLVVKAYIIEALDAGDDREATDCLQTIHIYLKADKFGRDAHKHICFDPLGIIRDVANHPGFDSRYRELTIANMIREIEQRRARREHDRARRQAQSSQRKRR
jgi:hypothetical protein